MMNTQITTYNQRNDTSLLLDCLVNYEQTCPQYIPSTEDICYYPLELEKQNQNMIFENENEMAEEGYESSVYSFDENSDIKELTNDFIGLNISSHINPSQSFQMEKELLQIVLPDFQSQKKSMYKTCTSISYVPEVLNQEYFGLPGNDKRGTCYLHAAAILLQNGLQLIKMKRIGVQEIKINLMKEIENLQPKLKEGVQSYQIKENLFEGYRTDLAIKIGCILYKLPKPIQIQSFQHACNHIATQGVLAGRFALYKDEMNLLNEHFSYPKNKKLIFTQQLTPVTEVETERRLRIGQIADVSRHAVIIWGFQNKSQPYYYKIQNSYGVEWGDNGHFRVSIDSFDIQLYGIPNFNLDKKTSSSLNKKHFMSRNVGQKQFKRDQPLFQIPKIGKSISKNEPYSPINQILWNLQSQYLVIKYGTSGQNQGHIYNKNKKLISNEREDKVDDLYYLERRLANLFCSTNKQ